ncbi:tyrosine-type recombinase/integrase [Clostridium tarantellae]|uniref:Tyrosine-type recombinase/integrase n=1 Tax=Clostridium tarantellae TaxID=39493 RepID=A0A6I1MQ87_9CLOT|nr:tyrosine-type recombinase/integrase [Clostridium tarantellae]MPQ44983.1 tyrosine-type recombinase/integrase [Clostridium tarantellae]
MENNVLYTENLINLLRNLNEDEIEKLLKEIKSKDFTENLAPVKRKKASKSTRPLEKKEFEQIIKLISQGFEYEANNKKRKFRSNPPLAFILTLQATLGLRISDVIELKVSHFMKDKIELYEKKTNKLQYKKIAKNISDMVFNYALEQGLKKSDKLINVKIRNIQQQLKIVTTYLGLNNISTHSFRKMYAVHVYEETQGDIELLKELLNHSSIAVTQKYIRVNQDKIDEVSESIDFTYAFKNII